MLLGGFLLLALDKELQKALFDAFDLLGGQFSVGRIGTEPTEVDLKGLEDGNILEGFAVVRMLAGRVDVGEVIVKKEAAHVWVEAAPVGDAQAL